MEKKHWKKNLIWFANSWEKKKTPEDEEEHWDTASNLKVTSNLYYLQQFLIQFLLFLVWSL